MNTTVFTRANAPVANARPADLHSYERRPGLVVDGSQKIEGDEEAVDVAKGLATGMALESAVVMDTEARVDPKVFDIERFMAEELEVIMHDPASEVEPEYVEIRVNGDYVCAKRDSQFPVKMRRYHVAILAQAKTASLKQKRHTDSEGFQGYQETVGLRQSYPFTVTHDPSGSRGTAWLRPLISSKTV